MMRTNMLWAVLALLVAVVPVGGAEVQWHPADIQAAMTAARAEGKLIYVFVEGNHCPPCDAFKTTHLADPAFIDFVNAVFVPIRVHQQDPEGERFLNSLKLNHPAVPRYYVMSADGRGLSMYIGMVPAAPMNPASALAMAHGRDLGVRPENAAATAARLRAHLAAQRAAGAVYPDNPNRLLGVAILEAEAWALAGRLDEAERALGPAAVPELYDQELRAWYAEFWLAWGRNLPGALAAAEAFVNANPDDPAGWWLRARALAANGRFADAVQVGRRLAAAEPENARVRQALEQWNAQIR